MDQVEESDNHYQANLNTKLEARRRANDEARAQPAREHCIECDEPIPARRREAIPGCTHCIDCQQAIDHHNRQYA